jgi:hypothetical protein
MSIAELIMTGTNRASESTAWVGDSLAKLGQNVGQALAQREQQKQAQEMLPFLQQSMQESMTLAGQGKTGEAYAKLMPFLADPSVINNPNLRQVIPAFESGIKMAGDQFYKKEELRIREDMYGARSDYQNSLLGLRQNQATAKTEVDARKLDIQEERLKLQREYYDARDENEKARIDIQLQRLDLDEERLDSDIAYRQQKLGYGQDTSFQQSYEGAAGIGGPRSAGTPLTSTDRTTIEQAAQDVTNAVLLPDEVPQQPTGIPAMGASETTAIPFTLESPAASFTQLGAQPYEPSERLLETFAKNSDKYNSASPKEKKQMNSERSIVYDNQDALKNDLPNLNTEQIGFTQVDAGVVDPELVGIKYLRNVEKGRNAQGKITGYEPNNGAAASIERLQTAFNVVNGRQDLRELYANAGGWQNVEIKSVPASKGNIKEGEIEDVSASFEVINKKNREQKVLVTGKDAELLQSIEMVVPISNTNKMDRVYLKGQQPTTAPAPTQGGMPAAQAGAAKATQQAAPEELDATNPFAKKISEQKASQQVTEAETSKTRTKDTIASLETKLKVLEKLATRKGFQPDDAANYKDYQNTKMKLDTLKQISVAESEGRAFASEAEARNSNKKFDKGTTIYIAGKAAVVQ